MDDDALAFQRPRHGTDTHPVEARDRVGAGRRQDHLDPCLGQLPRKQGEFAVIADQDAQPADGRVKDAQARIGHDIPFLAFEPRHDLLVLMADDAIRAEQDGAVEGPFAHEHRARGGQDVDAMRGCKLGMQRVAGRLRPCDLVQRRFEVRGDVLAAQRRKFHRAVFGKHQQVAVGCSLDPAGQLGTIGVKVVEPVELVGGGGDLDFACHRVFIQNCSGFRVETGASMSFQSNSATTPERGS